ncbi:hypothetical protein KKH24_01115, partial [Patescibacteria group bacterium]|nr:hypothetical protein [Patescibacteria group bacterium]
MSIKKGILWTLISLVITSLILLVVFLIFYSRLEKEYQVQADAMRIEDSRYMAEVITNYRTATGRLPLSNLGDEYGKPIYVIFFPGDTPEYVSEQNSDVIYYDDELFIKEIESVLDIDLTIPYDPQKVSTGGRPNLYFYTYKDGVATFAVNLTTDHEGAMYFMPKY